MLSATSLTFLAAIGLFGLYIWDTEFNAVGYGSSDWEKRVELIQTTAFTLLLLMALSLFISAGAFLRIAHEWVSVHKQCKALEEEAQELTTKRDS